MNRNTDPSKNNAKPKRDDARAPSCQPHSRVPQFPRPAVFASLLAAGVLAAAFLCGCGKAGTAGHGAQNRAHSRSFLAMGTCITLTAYGGAAEKSLAAAEETITELETLWSATNPESEIFAANLGGSVRLSAETADLLRFALQIAEETGGAFDPTVFPLVAAWGFSDQAYRVPAGAEIERLLEYVGYGKVELDGETLSLPAGTQLDLGGIGKGYAGDIATAGLKRAGVTSAILNLGGNVQAVGRRPDGGKWRIGIRDPFDGNALLGVLEAEDCAVVTSGGYERRFTADDGTVHHHILNPATGMPADSGLASVTIVAKSGRHADALSTALFVMGAEKARAHWLRHGDPDSTGKRDGFDAILVTSDGTVFVTEGIEEAFFPRGIYTENLTVLRRTTEKTCGTPERLPLP